MKKILFIITAIVVFAMALLIWTTVAEAAKTSYDREVAIDNLIQNAPAQEARIAALEQHIATLEARLNETQSLVATFQQQLIAMQRVVLQVFQKLLGR